MDERRKYIRMADSLKIIYAVADIPSSKSGSVSEDISGGGLRLPTKHNCNPGDILLLEVHLPKSTQPIRAKGEVAWSAPNESSEFPYVIGIRFTAIDPFDRGKILNYIRKNLSGSKDDVTWID